MGTRPKLLVVDDREENLLALEALLAQQDAELLTATSGDGALELLLVHEVALALIDVQMPEMDGFELARWMRASERARGVPIIFVTAGLHDQARVFEGYDRGAVDFLSKPLDPRIVSGKVGVFLQLWRQRQELAERVVELEGARAQLRASAETSRRQLEEIQATYDSAPVGMCVFDRELRYLRINQRLAELNGVPAAEHIGRRVEDVVPSLAPVARQIAERIFRTGAGVTNFEFTGCTPAQPGVERSWLEQWLPLKDARGAIVGINVVAEEITARKRAEHALRESEDRFRLASDAASLGVFEWEFATSTARWENDRMYEIFGRRYDLGPPSSAEFYTDIIVPEDVPLLDAALAEALATAKGVRVSFRIRRRWDRGERWVELFGHHELTPDGQPKRLVGVIADITDRKRTEDSRRESESFYRQTLESIPGMVFTTRPDGYCDYQSQQWADYTGVPVSEHLGAGWNRLLHPDDQPCALAAWQAAVQGKAHYDLEYRVRRHDGVYEWFRVVGRPIRDPAGQIVRWLGVALNIERLKQTEAALRASETRAQLLASTAGRLLACEAPQRVVEELCREVMAQLDCQVFVNLLLDPAARVLRLNACAGVPDESLQRLEALELGAAICGCAASEGCRIVAEDILHSTEARVELVRSWGVQAYCCHPLKAEGRVLGTLSFGTSTRAAFTAAEVEFMQLIAEQVSTAMQRMEASRALALANEQLEEADRRKNDFLAVLSHELRNPLAPIKNSLYVLHRAAPGGEQARRAKEVIDRQINQFSRLIDDLLDVTRVTRNKIALQRRTLELNELVSRAIEDQRSLFEQRDILLELRSGSDALFVHGDDARLVQVVSNLLQNAAKFTSRGGSVRVLVERDARSSQAVIRVRDTGIGMNPETITRLFQPFVQAETTLDRSRGGLGLGLALVRGLVELHGGHVSAHSDGLGSGSELVVRLPLVAGVVPAHGAGQEVPRCARLRVLIIEDNTDAADSLREVLELGGHEVEVAYDGLEGIATARAFRPEVVLCDIGLPGMDGYELAQALRADEALRGVRLVALSGYALPEDRRRAEAAGFDRHLAKPPSLAKVEELLLEFGDNRRPAGEAQPALRLAR